MDKIREILASNIEFYRKRSELTQADLAKSAKVSVRTIVRAEDPESGGMDIELFLAMAKAMRVHPSKLFLGPGEGIPISADEALEALSDFIEKNSVKPHVPSLVPPPPEDPKIRELVGLISGKAAVTDLLLSTAKAYLGVDRPDKSKRGTSEG